MDTSKQSSLSNINIPLLDFQPKQITPQRPKINIPLIDLSEQVQENDLTSGSIQTIKQFSSSTSMDIDEQKIEEKELVSFLQNWQQNFEQKISNPGAFYIIAGQFIFSGILQFKKSYFEQLSMTQLIFISFLVKFLINYQLIRKWKLKSYLENTQEHHQLKDVSSLILLSLITLIYSNSEISLKLWFCSSLILLIYQKIKKISIYYYKVIPYSVICNSIACLALIKVPNSSSILLDTFFGITSACIFIVAISQIQSFDKKNNSMTFSHVVLFFLVSFLPIFFPLENITPLGFQEIFFMIISGIMLQFAIEFFFRALQIYPQIKILLLLPCKFVADLLFQTIFGGYIQIYSSFDYLALLMITLVCTYMTVKKHKVQEENFQFPQYNL